MPAEVERDTLTVVNPDVPVECVGAEPSLPDLAVGLDVAPSVRQHVSGCLRCQADMVKYRRLLRSLRALRVEVLEPAPGFLPELLAAVEVAAERHAIRSALSGRRVAYLGGIAAATAAAGAGALVIAARNRRPRVAS